MEIFTVSLLIFNLAWTIFLYQTPSHVSLFNYLYNLSYSLNALLAAYLCFKYLRQFSQHSTTLILFGLGFLTFALAQITWLYLNLVSHTDVPYPSSVDLFWIPFYFLVIIGFISLLKSLKITFTFNLFLEITLTAGLISLIISSFLAVNNTQAGLPELKQLLNYLYPAFDALLVALGITIIRSQRGHLNPHTLYFIFGFIALTAGDTLFAYQTTLGTYWNGNNTDAIYALASSLLLLGTIHLPELLSTRPEI